MIIHIGFDDTDSENKFCTTYIGAEITRFLIENQIEMIDYPLLIRLNPNIPYKTRGNGAVCIRILVELIKKDEIIKKIKNIFESFTDFSSKNTNPGLVFWTGSIPTSLKTFAKAALINVLQVDMVEKFSSKSNCQSFGYKNKRGLIGAFSAIGTDLLDSDYTYELIAYRDPLDLTKTRKANTERIWDTINSVDRFMDTFSNADKKNKALKIIPHGPDPVFCGIRGDSTSGIISFWRKIQPQPTPNLVVIFRSNQGTEQHLLEAKKRFSDNQKAEFDNFSVICCEVTVQTNPEWIHGGHLIFLVEYEGIKIPCYAYEPTKEFRKDLQNLRNGDSIIIGGNVRPATKNFPKSINLEKVIIKTVIAHLKQLNPLCTNCSKRFKSLGKNQGYRCPKCRKKETIPPLKFEIQKIPRKLSKNQILLPAISAQRHLTKPIERYSSNQYRNPQFNYQLFIDEFKIINDKSEKN